MINGARSIRSQKGPFFGLKPGVLQGIASGIIALLLKFIRFNEGPLQPGISMNQHRGGVFTFCLVETSLEKLGETFMDFFRSKPGWHREINAIGFLLF